MHVKFLDTRKKSFIETSLNIKDLMKFHTTVFQPHFQLPMPQSVLLKTDFKTKSALHPNDNYQMKHLRSRGWRSVSYETTLGVVGDEGDSCNQKRNKTRYKLSVGIGFYFLLLLPLTLLDETDIMIRVFNFSYSLESPGKI